MGRILGLLPSTKYMPDVSTELLKVSKILEFSSSPLIKTFINKVDENQLINDTHMHPHIV